MGFIKKSIGGRLVTFFLLLVLIPLGLVGYLSYRSGRQSIIANVKSQLESIAILKAHQIENWTNHLQHTLVWLTQSPTVIKNADALAAYKT